MRPARNPGGFFRWMRINPRPFIPLSTTRSIEEEVFSSLHYLTEIPEVGKEFLTKKGVKAEKLDTTFLAMQAFVRQAKTFYEAAGGLHHRASPLNYYYAFLNLAKAYVCQQDVESVSGRIHHGLSHSLVAGDLRAQEIVVVKGVFEVFYRAATGRSLPTGARISVSDLFRYPTDISHECGAVGLGHCVTSRAQYRVQQTREGNSSFGTIAILRFEQFSQSKAALDHLLASYEHVDLHKDRAREVFGLYAEEHSEHSFFETKKLFGNTADGGIPVGEIAKHCHDALKPLYCSMAYENEKGDFWLSSPLRNDIEKPFNEILGIYVLTYFLSSLVRYYPSFLEQRLYSKDAWLIESFVRSTPRTFLVHMANLIIGEDRIYITH